MNRVGGTLVVRRMVATDAEVVARLHRRAYARDHFTSRFPAFLLRPFYRQLADNIYSFVAVDDHGAVIGVAIAGTHTGQSVRRFFWRYWPLIGVVALLNPSFLIPTTRGVVTMLRATPSGGARLLSLLTDPAHQGHGVARALTEAVEAAMRCDGVCAYRHSTKTTNIRAIHFYERNGCVVEQRSPEAVYFVKLLT